MRNANGQFPPLVGRYRLVTLQAYSPCISTLEPASAGFFFAAFELFRRSNFSYSLCSRQRGASAGVFFGPATRAGRYFDYGQQAAQKPAVTSLNRVSLTASGMTRTVGLIVGPRKSKNRQMAAKYLLLLALALATPASLAQGVGPDALLRAVAAEVIEQITQDQELAPFDPAKMAALVESKIVPLVDFVHLTRLAVARNWPLATPEQQSVLTEEFKTLLVRTYSNALSHYRGEVIEFKPPRAVSLNTEVTVRSEVKRPGQERMTLDYAMEKTPEGWKIYDVKLAGVRLVTTYREIFAEQVRDGGVDGLIKFLVDGNREGSSRFNSIKTSFWEKSRVMYAIFQHVFRSRWQ